MGKINWLSIVKGRKTSLFRTLSIAYGVHRNMSQILNEKVSNILVIGRDMAADWYVDKKEIDQLGWIVSRKIDADPNFAQEHFLEFKKRFCNLIDISKEIAQVNLEKLDNPSLGKVFHAYSNAYQALAPFMLTPHVFQLILEKKVKELIKKKGADENLFLDLSVPYQPIFETLQQKELLELTIAVQKRGLKEIFLKEKPKVVLEEIKTSFPKIYRLLELHEQKWVWVGMEDWLFHSYQKERLIEMIKENLGAGEDPSRILIALEERQKEIEQKAKKAVQELDFSSKGLSLISLLQKYIWLRTARLEAFRKSFYYTKPLILEIAKRAGLSKKEVYSLTPPEIVLFLKENRLPKRESVRKRIKGCVFLMEKGETRLYSGEKWPEEIEKRFGLGIRVVQKIIRGQPACLGTARGRVKIVLSKKMVGKVGKGDILVTTMTNPDYTIAMKKASAIITDEGGVTCHAAIIARELGIPCVIGTKIATQVLKDEDLVEVDAEKGLVKKVSNPTVNA